MTLEAVWFKDGKEFAWVDPVLDLVCDDEIQDISDIKVYNGLGWYNCNECPDDFVIRIKRED